MEQLTLFDLQNDLTVGSLCDEESVLCSQEASALVLRESESQELREAYTRALAPEAYRLSAEGRELPGTTDELVAHIESVRAKRLEKVDLSICEAPALEPKADEEASAPVPASKSLFGALKEDVKHFLAMSPTWFNGKKAVDKTQKRFPTSAFAAIGVLAVCLSLIVGGSILVTHGENAKNRLKKEISAVSAQIEDLQSEIHLSEDVLLVRELAFEKCGMIGEEYVRTETLLLGNAESVEAYPEGRPEGVGLSALLSAIGIKK